MSTGGAECRADCCLVGTVCTSTVVIYPRFRHAEPIGKTGLAVFATEADAACLRIARPVVWQDHGVWAAVCAHLGVSNAFSA